MDVTGRRKSDIDSARLAAIVESSDDAIISMTLEGEITSWNGGATRIFGYEAKEMLGRPIGMMVPPELQGEEKRVLNRLTQGEHIHHYETVRLAKGGRRVDISLSVSLLRNAAGETIGASKVSRDITQRKKAENLQRMLIEELNHRVKNTLATVQAVATQSLLRAKSPDHFVSGFSGRIQVLAKAHTLLTQAKWQGADVMELLSDQVLLHPDDALRISLSGPSLTLDSETALHLVLIIHELGTNARKHGALSTPEGCVRVTWRIETNGCRGLVIEWKESGGPPVGAPQKQGFGTTLIERTLRVCDGEGCFDYDVSGLSCRIKLPLVRAAEPVSEGDRGEAAAPDSEAKSVRSRRAVQRILVVEDEALLSMDIEASLVEAGYEVAGPAGTLEKARQVIAEEDFDAALVDANLAGRAVDDLVVSLTRRNIPFAFVTGYGRDALPRGFGGAALLSKPFTLEQLLEKVHSLLESQEGVIPLRQKKG
jgi:PAS domain S-box-containing protein